MNKKELKAYFGHPFGPTKKFERIVNDDKFVIFNDRSGNVIAILPAKPMKKQTITYRYTDYTEKQWLQRLNYQYKGRPCSLCQEEIFDELKIFE